MIKFFRKLFSRIFKREKNLILSEILVANQSILSTLRAIQGDSKSKGIELKLEVQKMSGDLVNLTKMIYDMVQNLSQYFKIEVEFMEKEKKKMEKKPTEHDLRF